MTIFKIINNRDEILKKYIKSIALAAFMTTGFSAHADVETTNHYTFSYGSITVGFQGDTGFLNYEDNTVTNIRDIHVYYGTGNATGPFQISGFNSGPVVITRTGWDSNLRAVDPTSGAELDIGNIDGVYSVSFKNMTTPSSSAVTNNSYNPAMGGYPNMNGDPSMAYQPARPYVSFSEPFDKLVWNLTEISFISPGMPSTTPTTPTSPTPTGSTINPSTDPMVGAVPEPETYAMMLAGLGAMGLVARRRRAA